MPIILKPYIVDEVTGGIVADIEDDHGVTVGEFDLTEVPESPGVPRRRLWTVRDAHGNVLGEGEL